MNDPRFTLNNLALAMWIFCASIFYWSGTPQVPFHPDESTYLFMSADWETLFTRPLSLAWVPGAEANLRMRYRLLDAPLTRDLIGAGRLLTGTAPLPVDWEWYRTWAENQAAGALPTTELLLTGRFAVASLFPFSLLLIYLTAQKLTNRRAGWIALILLSVNSLALIHTRRAMAESAVLFTTLLCLWGLASKKPAWLLAIFAGLAFSAKHSLLALALAAFVLIFSRYAFSPHKKQTARQLLIFLVIFLAVTLIFNPYMWKDPIQSSSLAIQLRQGLLTHQVDEIGAVSPAVILNSPLEKGLGLIFNVFASKLAISDVANYDPELSLPAQAYLSNPLHTILRDIPGGIINFAFTALGLFVLVQSFIRHPEKKWVTGSILFTALAQFASLALTVPLPFQRYAIPLLPYALLLSAAGVDALIAALLKQVVPSKKQQL